MTHTFKLARRISRLRAAPLASLVLVFACDSTESFGPTPENVGASFATAGGSITISNLSVGSGESYRVASNFASGATVYIDRSYTIQGTVPSALQGLTYIRTANDDKNAGSSSSNFLSFDINQNAVVYVAHDNRVSIPSWLGSGFQNTGFDVVSPSGDTRYSVFKRSFSSGRVTLGGNGTSANSASMYFVLVEPVATSLRISNLSVRSGKAYQVESGLASGIKHYIDRSYAVASSVPSALDGAMYIRTANDDKNAYAGSTSLVSFDVNTGADVYVGHDNRLARPSWLTSGFQDTGMDLLSTDTETRFSLFKRSVSAGRVTLGSNVVSSSVGSMYIVLVQPGGSGGVAAPAPSVVESGTGGISFGYAHMPNEWFGSSYNGALRYIWPEYLLKNLKELQARDGRIVLSLTGSQSHVRDAQGNFSFSKWKAMVDRYRGINFSAYIKDGTIVGHYILDEPNDKNDWNGSTVPPEMVDAMAQYSKSIWPDMPTIVRAYPDYLSGWNGTYRYLDAAWAQYVYRKGDVSDFIAQNVSLARSQGLALVVGLNVLRGSPDRGPMTASQIQSWGTTLLSSSYPCAFVNWAYDDAYSARSDVRSAMANLASKARNRSFKTCRGS